MRQQMMGLCRLPAIAGAAAVLLLACGGPPKDANTADNGEATGGDTAASSDTSGSAGSGDATADAGASGAEGAAKSPTSICTGFDVDLTQVLGQSACELAKPVTTAKDLKGVIDVKLTASAAKVAPGGHVDLVATFTNKSNADVALQFVLDPTARFSSETYDKKGNRADMPSKPPPALPADIAERAATAQSMAQITLVPNGSAHVQLGWDAVKMTWAPEKVRGTPPEMGYPRKPAGSLARGKYRVHLVTPLTNVSEGIDKEVSSPAVEIEVGK